MISKVYTLLIEDEQYTATIVGVYKTLKEAQEAAELQWSIAYQHTSKMIVWDGQGLQNDDTNLEDDDMRILIQEWSL